MIKYFDEDGFNKRYNVFKSRYMAKKYIEKIIKNETSNAADDEFMIIKINKYYRIIRYSKKLNN